MDHYLASTTARNKASLRPVPPRGFVGLVVIILIGVLIMVIGLTAAFIGQTQMIIAGQISRAQTARQAVAACVDEALYRLKFNPLYTGGAVTVDPLICTVTVSGSSGLRTITATAVNGDVSQAVMVTAVLRQNLPGNARAWSIDSWVEANP